MTKTNFIKQARIFAETIKVARVIVANLTVPALSSLSKRRLTFQLGCRSPVGMPGEWLAIVKARALQEV
jgi:hypothetical protein